VRGRRLGGSATRRLGDSATRRGHGALVVALVAGVFAASIGAADAHRLPVARTVWDSVYSAGQAARGESAYVKGCARCHGAALTGGDQSPPLAGSAFLGNWNGQSLIDLQQRIKTTMPSDSIGIYDAKFVTDVVAFMLKANGFPAGAAELASDDAALKDIAIRTSRPAPPN
jgi:mono/diheme cytochrome c family protein